MNDKAIPVAILAGGLATRLKPLTETVPKSLVDVNGEPFIAHQLRLLHARGIERAVICAGHLADAIVSTVGDGRRFGLQVEFSFDGPRLAGTAGAIKQALPLLDEAFFVLYGDSYLRCDYRAIQAAFETCGKTALMTVFRNDGLGNQSNVEFFDGQIAVYDKRNQTPQMRYIDYGLGVFGPSAFAAVPMDQPYDLADLYQRLLKKGELAAYEVDQRFYEIGSPQGLEETRRYLQQSPNLVADGGLQSQPAGPDAPGFTRQFLAEATEIIGQIDAQAVDRLVDILGETRDRGGRLFILGVGGSAANASHAVNDFRKIAGLEAYAPSDNVAELTARANDEGWASVYDGWLHVSRLREGDLVMVLSVGGGNLEENVSPNLVAALQYAKQVGTKVIGIVGRDGGYTAKVADACVVVPTVNPAHVTPHAESFQAVIWHLLVSHPKLKTSPTKWESIP